MANTPANTVEEREKEEMGAGKGKTSFSFTYDDTGATTEVDAPNGWTMQQVIDKGYSDETAQADDRVEFSGPSGPVVMTPELRALHVKEFVERRMSTDFKFHIVSKPGGAHL